MGCPIDWRGPWDLLQRRLRLRADEKGNQTRLREDLAQQLYPFGICRSRSCAFPSISVRPRKTVDQARSATGSPPLPNTIGMVAVRLLRRARAGAPGGDEQRLPGADQLSRERRQPIEVSFAKRYSIATFRPTTKPRRSKPSKNGPQRRFGLRRAGAEISDNRHDPCCAAALNGASATATTTLPRRSRRLMCISPLWSQL